MITLLFPPFADPTQSYPALPLLKGYLSERGVDSKIVDLNIETLLMSLTKEERESLKGFGNESLFYEKKTYTKSIQGLTSFYKRLSQKSGCIIDNNSHFDPVGPWNLKKLRSYFQNKKSPFHPQYENIFKTVELGEGNIVGINLTFVSQIPEAFYLAMLLKKQNPQTFIFLGGALAGQITVQIGKEGVAKLLKIFDAICFFEGGAALFSVHNQLSAHGKIVEPVPNSWILLDGIPNEGALSFVDFNQAPFPDFTGFPLDRYLAPSPLLLFHPSAGCYWNKCSFCHYGFNQHCATGYRELPVPLAISQVKALQKKWGVYNFYMSSDVLSPKFSFGFADGVASEMPSVKWSTDLRIEKIYTPENAKRLAKGGLVSAAFGVESGSDRLLGEMSKGIKRAEITEVTKAFGDAGVAVCWMMFHYHPTETFEEAKESVKLIESLRKEIALFILGEFSLTPDSIIFKSPERFGIKKIKYHPDDEFRLYPYPDYQNLGKNSSNNFAPTLDKLVSAAASAYTMRTYPYAGAISTHHSMLYFIKHGNNAFKP